MPRTYNPFSASGFSGPGYGGASDFSGGISSLARALFSQKSLEGKRDLDAAHTDYYKALSAKNGVEAERLRAAEGARSSIADIYRQVPTMMAGRNAQGPTPDGRTVDTVANAFFSEAPSKIAASAAQLPAAEQGKVADLFLFNSANTPGVDDGSIARALVGTGKTIGVDQAVSLDDREKVAGRNQAGKMAVEGIKAETARRGQDVGAETSRRGQDVGAESARRGQDVGAETARRGQDVGADTSRRGQDIGAETSRRGQDVGAETARRGQDIGAETARLGQDKRLTSAASNKVSPQDYRRYAGILSDIGGEKEAGDIAFEPDAESAIIGRAAEIYKETKDAVGATRQSLMEHRSQLERRDSSFNPFSGRRLGLKKNSGIVDAVTGGGAAPAAPPAGTTSAPSAPGTGGSAAGKHKPGDTVTVRGRQYTVAPDGDSLIPVQ